MKALNNLKACLRASRQSNQAYPVGMIDMMNECTAHMNQSGPIVVVGQDDLEAVLNLLEVKMNP